MTGRIIINADDLGLCASVNAAIFEVHRAGNLTSATLMVNMPGTRDAVDRAKDHPALGIGLHFCITEGMALNGVSSLTGPDGRFRDRATLMKGTITGKVKVADLRAELEAQLHRMAQMGLRPTHMDSHQHAHMIPGVFDAVLPILERERLPVRVVAPPGGSVTGAMGRPSKALKQWMNVRFARRAHARATVPTNDVLVSIHDLDDPGPYTAATYTDLVARAPGHSTVELMVHPYQLGADVLDMYGPVMDRKRPFLDRCVAEYTVLRGAPLFAPERLSRYGAW